MFNVKSAFQFLERSAKREIPDTVKIALQLGPDWKCHKSYRDIYCNAAGAVDNIILDGSELRDYITVEFNFQYSSFMSSNHIEFSNWSEHVYIMIYNLPDPTHKRFTYNGERYDWSDFEQRITRQESSLISYQLNIRNGVVICAFDPSKAP
jgi:hypothetical protein